MKVLLLKDVAKVGQRGTVQEVSSGYAQNFLFARGLAVIATPQRIKELEKTQTARAQHKAHEVENIMRAAAKIQETPLVLTARANEKGHLFEAIHAAAIVAALKDATGVAVDEHMIVIDSPIKEVGEHTVHVSINKEMIDIPLTVA